MGMILVVQSLENKDLKLKARFIKCTFGHCTSFMNLGPRLGIFFRLLIQIHDELVLEVHDDYIENVKGKNLHLCDIAVLV